jgi:CHAD domain-containing protein
MDKAGHEVTQPSEVSPHGLIVAPAPPALARVGIASREWEKTHQLALKHLDRFMSLESKVLQGDDREAVHNMRVASRRLQQVLDLIYPAPPPKGIRRLRRKIRRSRGALSEVRNCDVQIERVEKVLGSKRATHHQAWEAVKEYLTDRRTKAFDKALAKLSKVNLAVFYVRLKAHLTSNGTRPQTDSETRTNPEALSSEEFYQRIHEGLETVWGDFEARIEASGQDSPPEVIHGVRLAAKRLRYAAEVIREFNLPGTDAAVTWLRNLQQQLGDWHDLEVLEEMMIDMVARPAFLRDHLDVAMDVEKLILRSRTAKKTYLGRYARMTRDAAGIQRLQHWVNQTLSAPPEVFAAA